MRAVGGGQLEHDEKTSSSAIRSDGNLFVAGIGASAGGIAPLREFFSKVNEDSGIAYVVVLHLSPQHESNLPALLQSKTTLPVTQVTEALKVEPNHVYVIPPLKYLVMSDGMIKLTDPERSRGQHTSIDLFFRTLADAYGKDAAAILMSGTGVDGTIGLGRIKEQGGFVIVQDPSEAEYEDMPRSALDAGVVDLVLPTAEMPAKLLSLREGTKRLRIDEEKEEAPPPEFDEGALRNVLTLLRLRTGNDFSQYRRPTLLRRIVRRMQVHELHDLNAYLAFLRENADEIVALLRDLLITVTNFFRDHDAFGVLEHEIVPQLFHGKGLNDQIRIWCAGCATGEEAYSIAILMAEHAARIAESPKIQIFASDIDDRAILLAREARYPETITLDVSPTRVRQFFAKEGDHYQIKKQIRETVLFATHNVLRDPPFSKLDLVSCRNLLIYLNHDMQEQILEIFHFALKQEGFLFLGGSESAENLPSLYTPVDKKHRLYRRRAVVGAGVPAASLTMGKWRLNLPAPSTASGETLTSAGQLHQEVVEQLAPPSVLINEDYDVVHASATVGRYLQVAGGEPTRNLLKLVNPALRLDLRSALLEMKSRGASTIASLRKVETNSGGEQRSITLTVRPVVSSPDAARGFFLVTFDETSETSPAPVAQAAMDGARLLMAGQLGQLEQELQRTKDHLRITVEQYETSTEELRASNEELQAINEELRSATEELETSKEELQSVNEELTTVNQEYKEKIEEVGRANSDLQNLMASIDIGTIFLDRALQIKRYTPRARELFNITPADIGRPLEHFTNKLEYRSLHEDAERVLHTLRTFEREVRSTEGLWYLSRLTPYRTLEDKIDGVVLTFVDITNRKLFEERLERQTVELKEQAEILNLAHVMILDSDRRILVWNNGCEQLYGYSSVEAVGMHAHELLKTRFPCPPKELEDALQRDGQWQGELTQTTKSGTRLMVASHWIAHRRHPDLPPVILEVNSDITALRLAEEAAQEADRNKDLFLATLAHELRNPLAAMASGVEVLQYPEVDKQSTNRAIRILARQLKNLTRLVDDLLDVERLNHGRIPLRKTRAAVNSIVNAALESCQPRTTSGKHRLNVTIPPQSLFVEGDPVRLAQVVSNLLDNALKFTPEGGTIDLVVEQSGQEVTIRVRDTGVGISPQVIPQIFNLYFQAEPMHQTEVRGLGVGLNLVRRLTEMHGGTVTAHSSGLGRGAEFTVRLPLGSAASPEEYSASTPGAHPSAAAGQSPKRKVLIVDDNQDLAEAAALFLEANGHEVQAAPDGPTALRLVKDFQPDAAVVDIGLPGMDGYELAQRLRELLPDLPLAALSGWRIDPGDGRPREAGFSTYFIKPADPEKLLKFVANLPRPKKAEST
jgi:two-component system, chemotaxis family, CheB/CheR fusion protein